MYAQWRRYGRSFDLGRMDLPDLVRAYASHPAVHVYLVGGVLCVALATRLGGGWRLAPAVLASLLAYPAAWYLIHRFVLHGRFLYRWRATAALWKRIHFDHHQDPHRMDVLFGNPLTTLPTIVLLLAPLGWAIGGAGAAAAAVASGLVITCLYEFAHCIQHLNFTPRARWLRRMKELHLMHHFHHENGNYGITSYLVDRMCGTFYGAVRERKRSPFVFNLGYDLAESERFPWVAQLSGGPPRDRPPSASGRAA